MITAHHSYFRIHVNSIWCVLLFSAPIALFSVISTSAAPLEYNPFASLRIEGQYGLLNGRSIFNRNTGRPVTQNEFDTDLGMDDSFVTWRMYASARPLEHHLLRVYGSLPQHSKGVRILDRELITGVNTYPVGTEVNSDLYVMSFGFGYDLDLLVGPRWYGGLNAEFLYMGASMDITSKSNTRRDDTISISEYVPCFGAHVENRSLLPFLNPNERFQLGGFARIIHSITPNYLNYIDVNAGLSVHMQFSPNFAVLAKAGVERESVYHDQNVTNGNLLEFTRDGIFLSLSGSF